MFDLKVIARAIEQLALEKHIATDKVVGAVEAALAAAYKKEYEKRGEVVRAKFDLKTGAVSFAQIKTVADETTVDMTPPSQEEIAASAVPVEQDFRTSRYEPAEPILEEGKLPRYNPDRYILINEAHKIKSDAVLGEDLEFPLETKIDFGRSASQTAKQNILKNRREA